jgi:alpha-beta hydrolase superfamily lysophospholipase
MEKKSWMRPAGSGDGEVFSQMWTGDAKRGILQIAHGMAEHSERYDRFARFMAENGFVVCMNDHAGHGPHAATHGYFAERDGWDCLLRDMKSLMDETAAAYAGLPVFLMGHSMGSFLARSYVTRYAGLSGCVLSGTMGHNGGLGLGKWLAGVQKKIKGPKSEGKFLQKLMTGGFNGRIENPASKNAWLSTVDDTVRLYDADQNCGFAFTASGYYDMFSGIIEATAPEWAGKVPAELPVYLFSGGEDPVGAYGKGPREVYDALQKTGHEDVTLKLYPGKRHEMLNESNRDEVYRDVLGWLEARLPTAQ